MTFRALLAALMVPAMLASAPATAQTFPDGSRIGLVPPEGMTEADGFAGFMDEEDGASITLAELPAVAYPEIVKGFGGGKPLPNGMSFDKPGEKLQLSGGVEAMLYAGKQTTGADTFAKWVLLVKGPDLTGIVTAQAPSKSRYTDAAMRKALSSVTLGKEQDLDDKLAALPFEVEDMAGFRPVATVLGATLMLTDGPLDADPDDTQPMVVVASSIGAVNSSNREAYANKAFDTLSALDGKKRGETKLLENGAILTTGTAASKGGKPLSVRQILNFTGSGYIRTICTAPQGMDVAARCDRLAGSTSFRE